MENKTLSMVTIVPIRTAIEKLSLSESNSIAIQNFCKEYKDKLDSGMHEEQICEQFVVDLSKIAESETAKDVLKDVNEAVKANEANIKLANSVYNLSNGSCMFVAPMIESAVVDYIIDKNSTTRDNVKLNLSLFESDSTVKNILETLQYEQYEEKNGKTLVNAELKEAFKTPEVKTYTQEEVDKILNDKVNEIAKAEKNVQKKTKNMIKTHIGLSEAITAILKDNKNEKLKVFCEQYINALNAGKPEELLYESFISGISNWNYLSAVDTELSALKDRVSQYKQDIDLKKILDTMSQTGSYYIVPLIEDVVVDYVENKNMATRAILLQRLEAFEYDPFVRDMECLITRDLSIENTVYLGESVEYLNNQVKTELIFSPVQFIKENECVFNVKGAYFARKGNNIAKLTKNEVSELNESFKSLCNLVNSDKVKFSQELNSITVYDGANKCVITESEITVNDKEVTSDELKKLMETAIAMRSDDAEFYAMSVALNEHYNNIAYIDFVKRIESRDNSGKSCDVFKLKESIFVNTTNSNLGRSTFYRNVNPIQCRKYINEHMEINCGPLFEDELPEQEKVIKSIEDKKKEYQDYIDSLEEKKETLQAMKDEGADTEDIDNAIDMIDKELEDTKSDFLKYQKDSEKYLNGDDDDAHDSLDDEVPGDDDSNDKNNDKSDDSEENNDKVGDDLDPDKESAEDMEKPIEDETGETSGEDEFAGDAEFADVAEYDPDFDVPTEVVKSETEQGQSTDIGYGKFQIVKVSYNRNVKTGVENGHGEVILVIPSVDANGDVHDDMRKVTFYLDQDKTPIINNEYMPLDMYTQIVDAIINDPQTDAVSVGEVKNPEKEDNIESTVIDTSAEDTDDVKVDDTIDTNTNTEDKSDLQETPAEIQQADKEEAAYPITVGLYPEEIAPIEVSDFEKDLDDKMKIEHTESEANDGEICLKIANKAQAHALKKYFHEWKAYDDDQFCSFFPELQKCFGNKPANIDVMPANESVQIKGVKAISESNNDSFRVMLPCNEGLCKLFGIENKGNITQFQVIPENKDEEFKIYESLYNYARKNNGNVEQDVVDILEKYGDEYGKICESQSHYKLTVPYNNFLKQKLESKGISVNEGSIAPTHYSEMDDPEMRRMFKNAGEVLRKLWDNDKKYIYGHMFNNDYKRYPIEFGSDPDQQISKEMLDELSDYESVKLNRKDVYKLKKFINKCFNYISEYVPYVWEVLRKYNIKYVYNPDKLSVTKLKGEYNPKMDKAFSYAVFNFTLYVNAQNVIRHINRSSDYDNAVKFDANMICTAVANDLKELDMLYDWSRKDYDEISNITDQRRWANNPKAWYKLRGFEEDPDYDKIHYRVNGYVNRPGEAERYEKEQKDAKHERDKAQKDLEKYMDLADKKPLHRKGSLNRSFDESFMTIDILKNDFKKVKKVLESFYGDKAPIDVRDFFQFLNENVTITVKDDTTGKTVTINTDDFNGKTDGSTTENGVTPDFEDSFKNVTFNPEESLAFKDDDESADDEKGEDKKDEEKVTDNNEGAEDKKSEKTEDDESNEENSDKENTDEESKKDDKSENKDSEDEKPKKKFKFKVKKSKTDESMKENGNNHLNESELNVAEPNVLDYVKCKDGNKGQIICKQADGNFIVNVSGHTKIYPKSDVELVHARFDLVDTPFKYDDATLRGVYESYVNCGLFVNNTQVTPNDCKVQLLEFMTAKDDAEINLIIEGEKTTAQKKYIRITESLDEILDLANYSKGTMTYIVEGVEQKTDVLINTRDYQNYMVMNEATVPVRTLIFDENRETHMSNIPGGNLMICESEDYFKPEAEKLMENAIMALS